MKIIVDAMGGDNAPQAPIEGALRARKELGVEILLTGREEEILACLTKMGHPSLPQGVAIAPASQVIDMEDNPARAFKDKPDSSMTVGLNLLKAGQGDAFVSAGSTGALLSAATLVVKRIRGIRRAALAPVVPNATGNMVLIDCGATAECTPEYLLQFAYMGSYYAQRFLGIERPRVGLLNIGTEPSKGMELQKEAHALLTAAYADSTEVGSYKYRALWQTYDHIIANRRLLEASGSLSITPARVVADAYLLADDTKHLGRKPRRTYVGMRYAGGISDHLPVIATVRMRLEW